MSTPGSEADSLSSRPLSGHVSEHQKNQDSRQNVTRFLTRHFEYLSEIEYPKSQVFKKQKITCFFVCLEGILTFNFLRKINVDSKSEFLTSTTIGEKVTFCFVTILDMLFVR